MISPHPPFRERAKPKFSPSKRRNRLIRFGFLKIGLFRYWTQAALGWLDEATSESNHKFADL
jgi:hypothetical protein